jgi:hypothetical protein
MVCLCSSHTFLEFDEGWLRRGQRCRVQEIIVNPFIYNSSFVVINNYVITCEPWKAKNKRSAEARRDQGAYSVGGPLRIGADAAEMYVFGKSSFGGG